MGFFVLIDSLPLSNECPPSDLSYLGVTGIAGDALNDADGSLDVKEV